VFGTSDTFTPERANTDCERFIFSSYGRPSIFTSASASHPAKQDFPTARTDGRREVEASADPKSARSFRQSDDKIASACQVHAAGSPCPLERDWN
jgi:hypothetical protein